MADQEDTTGTAKPDTAKPDTAPQRATFRAAIFRSMKSLIQPLLIIASGVVLIFLLGLAQRMGWISAGGGNTQSEATAVASNTRYICPMMCTPPQTEPGRCPVCAMELVPAASGGGDSDGISVNIQPAARRLANIQTAAARSIPLT